MLTVREALALSVFASARVVAGQTGLDNNIRSVHIVDIPDTTYDWGRQGVLLLTAGFGLKDAPERQAALIPRLVERQFAGLVLSTGYYFQETPHVIKDAADDLNFPVIETPHGVLFIDLTEAIFEKIVNRQYAILQQSAQIHKQLTHLVLRGGDLPNLAETLATLLQRAVLIEDTAFQVLANSPQGPVDAARQRSVVHGYTTPEVARRLLEAGIYDQLLKNMAPMHVPPMPDLGMALHRLVVPIIVDREIYGYIWIVIGDEPLSDVNELAINHGATVAALIMLKEQAVREAQESMRGDFLNQLLRGETTSASLLERAQQLNYHLDRAHQVLLIQGRPQSGGNPRALIDVIRQWLRHRNREALLDRRDNGLIMVIESSDNITGQKLAQAMMDDLNQPAHRLLIGLGSVYGTEQEDPTGVRRSYEEAREAVRVATAMGQREGVAAFNDLGLLHWLYHVPPEHRAGNSYVQHIQTLVRYDAKNKTDLIKTLEIYLDHGAALVDAAATLYIHRNTLLHRLERIKQLCGLDLRDPNQRLNIHVALKSYRLHK